MAPSFQIKSCVSVFKSPDTIRRRNSTMRAALVSVDEASYRGPLHRFCVAFSYPLTCGLQSSLGPEDITLLTDR